MVGHNHDHDGIYGWITCINLSCFYQFQYTFYQNYMKLNGVVSYQEHDV